MYVRSPPVEVEVVDRWAGGIGWVAHPEEEGRRTSHAVVGEDGVWVLDPLDGPDVDELVLELGDVAGVVVLSKWHTRDADAFARRFDVEVHVPRWLDRVARRVESPTVRFDGQLGESGFEVERIDPMPGWTESIAYRASDRTLYVPDALLAAPAATVGDERLAVALFLRPLPPRSAFEGFDPERILLGHGDGVFDDASGALEDALAGARRRFPRAVVEHGPAYDRAALRALSDRVRGR